MIRGSSTGCIDASPLVHAREVPIEEAAGAAHGRLQQRVANGRARAWTHGRARPHRLRDVLPDVGGIIEARKVCGVLILVQQRQIPAVVEIEVQVKVNIGNGAAVECGGGPDVHVVANTGFRVRKVCLVDIEPAVGPEVGSKSVLHRAGAPARERRADRRAEDDQIRACVLKLRSPAIIDRAVVFDGLIGDGLRHVASGDSPVGQRRL